MGDKSKISWTDATWNPVTGCSKVSEGCRNCYAKALHDVRHKAFIEGKKMPAQYGIEFENPMMHYYRLEQPLRWKRPRKIFVNSMSDLFHPDIPFNFIHEVFQRMVIAHRHTFQVLTKRLDRALEFYNWWEKNSDIYKSMAPIPNIWFGATIENQERADERIPLLAKIPAAVRFISVEPMLGPVDLNKVIHLPDGTSFGTYLSWLDWVICGGESGSKARLMQPEWVRSLRDQCTAAEVPFFFKQWGEYRGYLDGVRMPGNVLDGQTWQQMPEVA